VDCLKYSCSDTMPNCPEKLNLVPQNALWTSFLRIEYLFYIKHGKWDSCVILNRVESWMKSVKNSIHTVSSGFQIHPLSRSIPLVTRRSVSESFHSIITLLRFHFQLQQHFDFDHTFWPLWQVNNVNKRCLRWIKRSRMHNDVLCYCLETKVHPSDPFK